MEQTMCEKRSKCKCFIKEDNEFRNRNESCPFIRKCLTFGSSIFANHFSLLLSKGRSSSSS